MAKHEKYKDFDIYTIISQDGHTRATFVPEKGGVGSSIIMPFNNGERELLFQHDHFWTRDARFLPGGWPVVFPICARVQHAGIEGNYIYDGKLYSLPLNGFAPKIPWGIKDTGEPDKIILTLRDSHSTLENYPFSFLIELEYQVSNGMLICNQRYSNTGDKPMPYYAGFHPYFLTPPAGSGKEKVILDYKPIQRFCYNEQLTDLVGTQALFPLPSSVAEPMINEQLVELGPDKLITLNYPDGFAINMLVDGVEDPNLFSYVQLYTQPSEPFICVEPWMGVPHSLDSSAEICWRWLRPGQSEHGVLKLWV